MFLVLVPSSCSNKKFLLFFHSFVHSFCFKRLKFFCDNHVGHMARRVKKTDGMARSSG